MKSTREVAEAVLARRSSLSPVVMSGDLTAELGREGLQDALAHGWIVPDYDSGFLKVTNLLAKVQEMETVVNNPNAQVGDTVIVSRDGRAYQGTVKSVANGKAKVSFGAERPTGDPETEYTSDQLKIVGRPGKDGRTQPVEEPARRPVSASPVVP